MKGGLECKDYPWLKEILAGIFKAYKKLMKYFDKTFTNLGTLYALGTILAPENKLQVWQDADKENANYIEDDEQSSTHHYQHQLKQIFERFYATKTSTPLVRSKPQGTLALFW